MTDSERLQAILDQIEAGKQLNPQELKILLSAVRSQQVTIATGDRAVAIGGSADGAVILTGDRNLTITGVDAEAIREWIGTRPRSEKLLLQAVKEEVNSRLKQSLPSQVLIQLGMETQPDQVQHSWDSDIKIGAPLVETIPANWNIARVFDEVDGKLLILGDPGSGKTTTLLELAKLLCDRTQENTEFPIPVLLNLSTWKYGRWSMRDWLLAELKSKYGVRKKVGLKWLDNAAILPMLDGLDELDSQWQESCVKAINQFLQSEHRPQHLVVCSRREEYISYETKLLLNGTICLQSLENHQIQNHLAAIGQSELWDVACDMPDLLGLIRRPLLLSLTVFTYKKASLEQLQSFQSVEEQIHYLMEQYIQHMLQRSLSGNINLYHQNLSQQNTQRWLTYLAQQQKINSQTDFLIEKIQPNWVLKKSHKKLYKLFFISIYGLIFSLGFGLIVSLYVSWIVGLFVGVFISYEQEIKPIESLRWSSVKMSRKLFLKISIGFGFGVIAGLMAILLLIAFKYNMPIDLYSIIYVISCGLIAGFVVWLTNMFVGPDIEIRKTPNQGIWQSLMNAGFFGLLIGIVPGILTSILFRMHFGVMKALIYGFIILLGFALLAGLGMGGKACIQHFSLRLVFYLYGYSPWNYARFLNYCTDRLLLQRVGGRYRFIHRLLQEHFAKMSLEQPSR